MRSKRKKLSPTEAEKSTAPEHDKYHTATAATAKAGRTNTAKSTRQAKERKQRSDEPAETKSEPDAMSDRALPIYRYVCPIPGCIQSRSQARSLKGHYIFQHANIKDKDEWDSRIAIEMPYLVWLEDERLATPIELKKFGHLLPKPNEQWSVPEQAVRPRTDKSAATDVPTVADVDENLSESPAKRRKLDALMKKQRTELGEYLDQELRRAEERTRKADAKLKRLTADREIERMREQERMEKMEEEVRDKTKEIEDEKAFGSSTELKLRYLKQARREAEKYRSLMRPEHGGFVY